VTASTAKHRTVIRVRRSVSPVILEKDFWVCWLLDILFESQFADSLVFKGSTSLSKSIQRQRPLRTMVNFAQTVDGRGNACLSSLDLQGEVQRIMP
jgi:hypothetical protein